MTLTTMPPAGIRIAIDRGGTFTDVSATFPDRPPLILKVLSVDPSYPDAPTEAIRRVLEYAYSKSIPRGEALDVSSVQVIRMGTTVATNALLERKGERTALLVTKGFKDILRIGNQSRPNLFDIQVRRPGMLYEEVIEVDERVVLADAYQVDDCAIINGVSGEQLQVLRGPNLSQVRKELERLFVKGIRSLSIAFMHSYTFHDHEVAVGELALDVGFSHVSLSCKLSPMIRIVSRGLSATADAYLTPELKRYLAGFQKSFANLRPGMIQFMQSDGGLVKAEVFSGLRAVLSGPAGGVVGYARTCYDEEKKVPVIGFDMGGTSTDVSRFDGEFEHVMETTTSGVTIQAAQFDINTVAAGGGSILKWENGLLKVGPESAGALPGPACYRRGGPLAVTDANVFLGRLLPSHFPKIFGPNEDQPLDVDVVRRKFHDLATQISKETGIHKTPESIALGFLTVATEAMCNPIRTLSEARGHETSTHWLAVFGGAGGQSGCDVAATLAISRVIIHKCSAILSAFGIAQADVVHESQAAFSADFTSETEPSIRQRLAGLKRASEAELLAQGCPESSLSSALYCNMRYEGADAMLMIREPEDGDFVKAFKQKHHQDFGFSLANRAVIVDDLRARVVAAGEDAKDKATRASLSRQIDDVRAHPKVAEPFETTTVCFESLGWVDAGVYKLSELPPSTVINGPAMIIDETQTIVVVPNAEALILNEHIIIDIVKNDEKVPAKLEVDPVLLSVFGHRFMAIADQMGRVLQKTSVSVNIKERLDFSCALFSAEGNLVANAPHVPAMLGSMGMAVQWQHQHWKGKLVDGDILLSNHPVAGGVHLPDITVVTPVFDNDSENIIFYVASRGHHADVGGSLPGSMPPNSKTIFEEGASIMSFKVVSGGKYDEAGLKKLLVDEPARLPGGSGTRTLRDNISDINAQISATFKGVTLVKAMISKYSLNVVLMYMYAIQRTAEEAVRSLLREFSRKHAGKPLVAVDHMDDGTPVCLKITIDAESGDAEFDFTGTGPEVYGNWNAPRAICNSAIIYALRCLLDSDIPLNQGCLNPIKIVLPEGCFLNPSPDAAVCAGNVLTSQRVTDVVFKAFQACGASQGCMSNLTFGYDATPEEVDEPEISATGVPKSLGFYETIAGGAGAGPTWHGTSGVQTNMTNTRSTDPEIFERRYPVILRQFRLREGSGGRGQHRGGEGVVRELEFRRNLTCSILSERRGGFLPYGMAGGEPAKAGMNLWISTDAQGRDRVVNMGGKNTVPMKRGDRIMVMTPGGGGYGPEGAEEALKERKESVFVGNGSYAERIALQHSN